MFLWAVNKLGNNLCGERCGVVAKAGGYWAGVTTSMKGGALLGKKTASQHPGWLAQSVCSFGGYQGPELAPRPPIPQVNTGR